MKFFKKMDCSINLQLNDESLILIKNLILNEFKTTLFYHASDKPSELIGVISNNASLMHRPLMGIKKIVLFNCQIKIIDDIQLIHCKFSAHDVTSKFKFLERPWYLKNIIDDSNFYKWVDTLNPDTNTNTNTKTSLSPKTGNYILDKLIVSNDSIYNNLDQYPDHYIINVSNDIMFNKELNDTNYIHLPIQEFSPILRHSVSDELMMSEKYMHTAVDLIFKMINLGKTVLLHCALGRNRSPSVAILYLIKYKNMSLKEAYFHVATRRLIKLGLFQAEALLKYGISINKDDGIVISKLACDTFKFGDICWSWNLAMYDLYLIDKLNDEILKSSK